MNEQNLRGILKDLDIEVVHKNGRGWLVAKCPYAPFLHEFGTDSNPSFFVKINETGFSGFNCFQAETRYLTKYGVRSFAETVGTTQQVLAPNGRWVNAKIKPFGKQELVRLTLSRNGSRKEILTTLGHRWFKRGQGGVKFREATTDDLQEGDRLMSTLPIGRKEWRMHKKGIAHGTMFGDGTARKARKGAGHVLLFGEKMALARFFDGVATTIRHNPENHYEGVNEHIKVSGPLSWMKELPRVEDHTEEYLLGFIAGYLATDGHVSSGVSLSSVNRNHLCAVRDICTYLGIGTFGVSKTSRVGYGSEATDLFSINFIRSTLHKSLFVRPDQTQAFSSMPVPKYERLGWQVVSVERTGKIDEVYCAEVPSFHAFVLEDNLTTGNCLSCHSKGNLVRLISRLAEYREEDYNKLIIRAMRKETPDRFEGFDAAREIVGEEMDPLDAELHFRMYGSAWDTPAAKAYLEKRGVTQEACNTLQLRFDPDSKRIMFPVYDFEEKLYGFTARTIMRPTEQRPKVRDYAGLQKDQCLLGENLIDPEKPMLLVEGLFAMAHMVSIGARNIVNPVASMGSSLSATQANILADFAKPVYILYDLDFAGDQGILGIYNRKTKDFEGGGAFDKLKKHVPTFICDYPEDKTDPDKFTLKDLKYALKHAYNNPTFAA